jgi:hypothetical protein
VSGERLRGGDLVGLHTALVIAGLVPAIFSSADEAWKVRIRPNHHGWAAVDPARQRSAHAYPELMRLTPNDVTAAGRNPSLFVTNPRQFPHTRSYCLFTWHSEAKPETIT